MNILATNAKSLTGAVFILGSAVLNERTRRATAHSAHPSQHTPAARPATDTSANTTGSALPPTPEAYIPGAREGLSLLARQPLPVVVLADTDTPPDPVCQRTDVALGQRGATRERIREVVVDGIYYCANARDGSRGTCRIEQRHALAHSLRRLAERHGVDVAASVLISDNWADLEAGAALGCVPILVMTGQGREQISAPQTSDMRARTWYAADLVMAALSIEAHVVALSGDDQYGARTA